MPPREPSSALRDARRALDGICGYRLLDDLAWQEEDRSWFLRCRLTTDVQNGLLPPATDWCVVMEDSELGGSISIYPAVNGGFTETYPHQRHNGLAVDSRPWRTGRICTTTPQSVLGRLSQREEPLRLEERLTWHVERALWWTKLASAGALTTDGDPYELPDFPPTSSLRFAFSEDAASFPTLYDGRHRSGLARLRRLALPAQDILALDQIETGDGVVLHKAAWGTAVARAPLLPADAAKWVLLDSAPLAGPWQVPVTFRELSKAMTDQGLSFAELVLPLPGGFRDGHPHPLLIGFPIPEVVGGSLVQFQWQALLLPSLERDTPGFRKNETGWRETDRRTLASNKTIHWLRSENWSPVNSHARGRFAPDLTERTVLLIGAGALGSAVAELLVRGGLKRLVVSDSDTLEQGNLARHTLTLKEVGASKAEALASRLCSISPHVQVDVISSAFPNLTEPESNLVARCDLVVDCTAEDSTLWEIEKYPWSETAYVASMAFGWYVHRLYVVGAPCREFTGDGVITLLHPLEAQDRDGLPAGEMGREGPGCWHPVFPGRTDDVWAMAAMGVKELERMVVEDATSLRGTMFEWTQKDSFEGTSRRVLR